MARNSENYFVVIPKGTSDIFGSTIGKNGLVKSEDGKTKIAYAQILPQNGNGDITIEIHGYIKRRDRSFVKYPRYIVNRFDESEMELNRSHLERRLKEKGVVGKLVRI